MRNRISTLGLLLALLASAAPAGAEMPTVASLDAQARASGNLHDLAVHVGDRIFATKWPAQVSQVSANGEGSHVVLGVRMWGVKFHHPLTRPQFVAEVVALIEQAFAAAPSAEEVDLWTSVPISVGKGVIVSGDLAKPTSRVVYSITVRRAEPAAAMARRAAGNDGVFWDEDWARLAL
ncbi:MAG TPA: hypothetical protein VMH02_00930 [Verrucomicrobiae bacterium]|nr:hypothetical protein [Verrucomicrobiae bacterium]